MPARKFDGYRVKRWPVASSDSLPHYEYSPQYWDKEAQEYQPYPDKTYPGKPRLFQTKLEAEQFIELQIAVVNRTKRKETNEDRH